jgi:hypothetical protein
MDYAYDKGRDAYRTIAGFDFQVNSTIPHWLNLEPGAFAIQQPIAETSPLSSSYALRHS